MRSTQDNHIYGDVFLPTKETKYSINSVPRSDNAVVKPTTTSTLALSLFLDKSSRSREVHHVCSGYLWAFSAQLCNSGFVVEIRPTQSDFLHRPVLHFPVKKRITIFILPTQLGTSSLARRFITFVNGQPIHLCFAGTDAEVPFRVEIPWPDDSVRYSCLPFNVVKMMVTIDDYYSESTRL